MSTEAFQSVLTALPKVNETVVVVTPEFRCMGYLDAEGIWRQIYQDAEIKNVSGWFSLD